MISRRMRYRGSPLGFAADNAIGATVVFRPPGAFKPTTDMVGGGPFDLKPGQWTDGTAVALCLAESLTERDGFDAGDRGRRIRWAGAGRLSATGRGRSRVVKAPLWRCRQTGEPLPVPPILDRSAMKPNAPRARAADLHRGLLAARPGHDASATAIYGQLAGSYYGFDGASER